MTDMPSPNEPGRSDAAGEPMDAAGRSLADALRLSFRFLSLIMIVVLVAFALTGLTQVQPNECGVRLLFGRIDGAGSGAVIGEGLTWSWPEPIGRIVKVNVGQRELAIDEFWFHESPADALKPLRDKLPPSEGLRPGRDGALLTGDRGLVHVKVRCFYTIRHRGDVPDPDAVLAFLANVRDPAEMVRSAVCNAAIDAAATRTVDAIYPTGQKDFADAIAERAQQHLDRFASGLQIQQILVPTSTVPLEAVGAFDAVTSARQDADRKENKAMGEATLLLLNTAGASWAKLVGNPGPVRGLETSTRPAEPLLVRYARARERLDAARRQAAGAAGAAQAAALRDQQAAQAEADDLLKQIDQVLMSNETGGAVAQIFVSARAYRDTIVQRVDAWARTFEELLPRYQATPALLMSRLWEDVRSEVLNRPTNEAYYLTGAGRTFLQIGRPPETARRIRREFLKAETQQRQAKQAARQP